MDEAKFNQLFSTWQKQRIQGKLKGTATTAATKRLISLHQEEYNRLYEEEYANARAKGIT